MSVIKPASLKQGDTIGIVAPGDYSRNNSELLVGRAALEKAGYRVKVGASVGERYGYFAGTDQQRADDFNAMLRDADVRAILTWGSIWGATRLLPLIDFEAARHDPKIIVGCGNVTALLNAFYQRVSLVTFHGAALGTFLGSNATYEAFIKAITVTDALGSVGQPRLMQGVEIEYPPLVPYVSGSASGVLVGGNLGAVALSLGTPDEIDTAGKIVVLEARDTKPEMISRYLTVLINSGKLSAAAGIVVGKCVNCVSKDTYNTFSFEGVLEDRLMGLAVPSLYGLRIGQARNTATIPLGVRATLDTESRTLVIDEAALT